MGQAGLAVDCSTGDCRVHLRARHRIGTSAEYHVNKIKSVAPWSRATPESCKVGAGFMMLANTGSEPDRLSGGSTEVAAALQIHEIHIVNVLAMLRQLNPDLSIKPGASVLLKPPSRII